MSVARAAAVGAFCWGLAVAGVFGSASGQEEVPRPPAVGGPLPEMVLPQFPDSYGPLDAGRDAQLRGEAERQQAIGRQLAVQDSLAWYYSLPGHWPYPPGLEAAYAGPRWRAPPILGPSRAYRHYSHYPVFEPWAFVPGDIYGYPYFNRVPQPLGHQIIAKGPNSYIYRPFYQSDLRPSASPTLPREVGPAVPPASSPAPEAVPAPLPEAAPREF